MAIELGAKAPLFSAHAVRPDGEEAAVSLEDYIGQVVVLYFYPKDDTPGCTAESCGFRDLTQDFAASGAVIFGLSPDNQKSHRAFQEKYALPFTLLSDPDHAVAEAYGVWKEKKNYGKTYMGIERTTFIIDRAGSVAKIFPKVSVEGHVQKVLEAVRAIEG